MKSRKTFLESLCMEIYEAERDASEERKKEHFGDTSFIELVIMRKDKVRIEIRKEAGKHHEPHMHITHSDKIDVSISLNSFKILSGHIDSKTQAKLLSVLTPKQKELCSIWDELNEKENSAEAEKLISSLGLTK